MSLATLIGRKTTLSKQALRVSAGTMPIPRPTLTSDRIDWAWLMNWTKVGCKPAIRNAELIDALVACFTPDAVHYFPPGLPDIPWWRSDTIARKWIWCVETLGSQWPIEKVLCSSTAPEAVIEWTRWKNKSATALRGAEWYV